MSDKQSLQDSIKELQKARKQKSDKLNNAVEQNVHVRQTRMELLTRRN